MRTEKYYESDMNNLKYIAAGSLFNTLIQRSLPNPCITCKNLVDT